MAAEQGDWVRAPGGIEGEVTEVRGSKVTIERNRIKLTIPVEKVRVATRPQSGTRRGGKR